MARIHKINGYLIDPNGDYNADNIEIGITERSGLDVFSQHLHVETAECGEFGDEHPLNKVDCDLAECEKYFPKQSIAHGVIETILQNVTAAGKLHCLSKKCNKDCTKCEHNYLMETILELIKGGGVNDRTGSN